MNSREHWKREQVQLVTTHNVAVNILGVASGTEPTPTSRVLSRLVRNSLQAMDHLYSIKCCCNFITLRLLPLRSSDPHHSITFSCSWLQNTHYSSSWISLCFFFFFVFLLQGWHGEVPPFSVAYTQSVGYSGHISVRIGILRVGFLSVSNYSYQKKKKRLRN